MRNRIAPPAARALVFALFFVLPVFAVLGCEGDYRPRASGPEGELTVVMDSSHWTGTVGEALRENLTPWVRTLPVQERYFEIRHVELSDERVYERIQDLKNVIIIAPLSDSTNEANFLRRRLSEKARQAVMDGQMAVVERPDLWRRSQRVYFITAASSQGLVTALNEQGSSVRNTFKEATLQRMEREMYDRARQLSLEDTLMSRHGFAVNVQHDFQIAIDTTTDSTGFIWLRRLLSKTRRGFFVYYIENASASRITPQWIYETRDSLARQYFRGSVSGFLRIDYRRPLETTQIDFLGRYAYESRGLWHLVAPAEEEGEFNSLGQGGPFVNYTFYDQASDRIYMLDGSVFAPEFDKLSFIRQMEVMARTFRTAEEADDAEEPSMASSTE